MSGYIGSKASVTQVDGYNRSEADAEFVQDPNDVITVSGSNVGVGTSLPEEKLHVEGSLKVDFGSAGGNPRIYLDHDSATDDGNYLQLNRGDDGIEVVGQDNVKVRTSGAEAMRIDSNGNVGIGTGSPGALLHVADSGAASDDFTAMISSFKPNLVFQDTSAATINDWEIFVDGGDMAFLYGDATTGTKLANEAMRIDNNSNLLLNTTSTVYATPAQVEVLYDGSSKFGSNWKTTTGDGIPHNFVNSSGTRVGYIYCNDTSTGYNTSSDYRLKTDAQPMTGASARVQALNPVNFEWIADGTRVDGFLAHEAQEVVPEAVTGTKDAVDADGNPEHQGIDQSKLVPLLTAALQEALTKIDDMETRLAALEGN
jgi:hypothetical protein